MRKGRKSKGYERKTTTFLLIGGEGGTNIHRAVGLPGCNGGRNGGEDRGGGATDIRFMHTDLHSFKIVSGGGGGARNDSADSLNNGGDEGGINGTTGDLFMSRYACGSQTNSECRSQNDFIAERFGNGNFGGGGGTGFIDDKFLPEELSSMQTGANIGNGYSKITPLNYDYCYFTCHKSFNSFNWHSVIIVLSYPILSL